MMTLYFDLPIKLGIGADCFHSCIDCPREAVLFEVEFEKDLRAGVEAEGCIKAD